MTTWIKKYEPAKLQFDGTCPDCGCGLHGADCSNTNCGSRRKAHGIPCADARTPEKEAPLGGQIPQDGHGHPREWEMICPSCQERLFVMAEQAVCLNERCERRMKAA